MNKIAEKVEVLSIVSDVIDTLTDKANWLDPANENCHYPEAEKRVIQYNTYKKIIDVLEKTFSYEEF